MLFIPPMHIFMSRLGGGCITGEVDELGRLTGDNLVYIYPDFKTCLQGRFKDGQFISGHQTSLKTVSIRMVKRANEKSIFLFCMKYLCWLGVG